MLHMGCPSYIVFEQLLLHTLLRKVMEETVTKVSNRL